MNNILFKDQDLFEQLKQLTLERVKTMPGNTELAIGSKHMSKEELIKHIAQADDIGKELMTIQLEFLQDLASGEIYKDDDSNYSPQTR